MFVTWLCIFALRLTLISLGTQSIIPSLQPAASATVEETEISTAGETDMSPPSTESPQSHPLDPPTSLASQSQRSLPPPIPVSQDEQLKSILKTLELTPIMDAEWKQWTSLERGNQLSKMRRLTGYSLEREFNIWRNRADMNQLSRDFDQYNAGDDSAIDRWKQGTSGDLLTSSPAADANAHTPPPTPTDLPAASEGPSASALPTGDLTAPPAVVAAGSANTSAPPAASDGLPASPAPGTSTANAGLLSGDDASIDTGTIEPPPASKTPPPASSACAASGEGSSALTAMSLSNASPPTQQLQQPPLPLVSLFIPHLTLDEVAGARVEGLAPLDYLRQGFRVLTQNNAGQLASRGPYWIATVYKWAQLEEEATIRDVNLVS